jgi:hypothetical protein
MAAAGKIQKPGAQDAAEKPPDSLRVAKYGAFSDPLKPAIAAEISQLRQGSCPAAWCSRRGLASMLSRVGTLQLAVAGRLKLGSLLIGAMVSSVM